MKKFVSKKRFLATALLAGAITLGLGSGAYAAEATQPAESELALAPSFVARLNYDNHMKNSSIEDFKEDTRVFAVDKDIRVQKVHFQNHYGFMVAADLYLPDDFNFSSNKHKAVVVAGPFGAVKEQASGLYAQEMAKHGYVALAFDPSTTGESSGERRNVGSPELFTEDYHAAVDFLANQGYVDPDRIGAIGICGLSGMAITATASDPRIKAVATSAMYDMSESIGDHYKGAYYTPDERAAAQKHVADLRTEEARTGTAIRGAHEIAVVDGKAQTYDTMFPDALPMGADSVTTEFYNYYVGRAYHPRAINSNTSAWDGSTPSGFYDFNLMDNINEIGDKPVLLITGDKAHSKYFSDDVYEKLPTKNKEEIVVPGATHTDLYDQFDKIPFDRLVAFFDDALR